MKVHATGENDCNHCGKGAKTGVKLNLHKMKVHESGENDCCHCGNVATVSVKLKLHIMKVHECPFTPGDSCGNGGSGQTNVKMHKSGVHGEESHIIEISGASISCFGSASTLRNARRFSSATPGCGQPT